MLLARALRPHLLWYRDNGLVAYAFVLGDHLSAEEENQGANLYTLSSTAIEVVSDP
jgi:hypothetical protein